MNENGNQQNCTFFNCLASIYLFQTKFWVGYGYEENKWKKIVFRLETFTIIVDIDEVE